MLFDTLMKLHGKTSSSFQIIYKTYSSSHVLSVNKVRMKAGGVENIYLQLGQSRQV